MTGQAGGDGRDSGRFCGGKKRQTAGTCTRPAGWGTDHPGVGRCKLHGGSTGTHRKAARKQLALAEVEAELAQDPRLTGRSIDVRELASEMLDRVASAKWRVAVLERLVEQLTLTVGPGGIAANTGSKAKPNEAEPHVFVAMLQHAEDRLMQWLKWCRDLGVEERLVELEEDKLDLMAAAFRQFVTLLAADMRAAGMAERDVERIVVDRAPALMRAALEVPAA